MSLDSMQMLIHTLSLLEQEPEIQEQPIVVENTTNSDDKNYLGKIEEFLFNLGPDDVGVEKFGPYTVHFEGFSDYCQQDANDRCHLPKEDPRHLDKYEDIYDEVLRDFINREDGKMPIESGLTGDEEYPIYYAIFKEEGRLTEDKSINTVAYHGSTDDIAEFRPFSHFGSETAAKDRMDYKKVKNGKVYKVELNINNPLEIKDFPGTHYDRFYAFTLRDKKLISQEEMEYITTEENPQELRKRLLSKLSDLGIDGFVYKNRYEDKGNLSYVIVDPRQAKIVGVDEVALEAEEITEAKESIKDQIEKAIFLDGGNIDDYFVRHADIDKLGYSANQAFGRSPDIDDENFDIDFIGVGVGNPALWFYPLRYYLKANDPYASNKPHVWLVKLKPNAWLQPVDKNTKNKVEAPQGKERVGLLRKSTVPSAVFFKPGFEVVDKFYDYGSQHKRHGEVKGPAVNEASPNTLEGSFTPDLVESKTWLCEKLAQGLKGKNAGTIYILGSWYGNMAIFLKQAGIKFDKLVLVEPNEDWLRQSKRLLDKINNDGKIVFLNQKAEDIVYDKPGVVINTSCNETGPVFLTKVPDNMLCLLQARDNVDKVAINTDSLSEFDELFNLSKVYYTGEKTLNDPETEYTRYMKIGRK